MRIITTLFICLLVCLGSATVAAQENLPVDRDLPVVLTLDRTDASDGTIWGREFVSYNDTSIWGVRGHCLSDSDPTGGACATKTDAEPATVIRIRFVESRTGLTVDLLAEGIRTEAPSIGAEKQFGMAADAGSYRSRTTTYFTVVLPASEVRRFPVGGLWTADLHVVVDRVDSPDPGVVRVRWNSRITARVTDEQHIDVYLPAFGSAPPVVDLNLTGRPPASGPGSTMTGHQVIDACLYDGYNAHSEAYEITVTDAGAPAGSPAFGVRHVDAQGAPAEAEVVTYTVTAPNPATGTPHAFSSGQKETFNGANTGDVRLVSMPFTPIPVACTPWPITLDTPAFNSSTKKAGRYTGTLQVVFSPSTASP